MLVWNLLGALAAAVCFGLATVLQAIGMRRAPSLAKAVLTLPMIAGVGLDLLGFGFELAALRHLPLFLVQSAVAGSLAVTAIAAAAVIGERLSRRDWLAVGAVCLGLAALGISAGPEGATRATAAFYWSLAAALVLLGALGALSSRSRYRTVLLGLTAGLCFGILALAARTLPGFTNLLHEPAAYLAVGAGLVAFVLWTTALSSGSVTTATAAMVIGQTVLPAAIGVLVLGDEARQGFLAVAAAGFLLAVGGALSLARYGEVAA
jgi:drug/metabolite transporter (DMT)-like permease